MREISPAIFYKGLNICIHKLGLQAVAHRRLRAGLFADAGDGLQKKTMWDESLDVLATLENNLHAL